MLQPRNRHIEKWPFLIINSIQNVRAFKCQKLRTPLASLALCVIDIGSLKLTKIPLSMKEFTLSKYDTKKKTCEIHTVNNILFSCEMYVYRQTVLLAINSWKSFFVVVLTFCLNFPIGLRHMVSCG